MEALPWYFTLNQINFNSPVTHIPMFIAAIFTIAKLWKHPRCPTTDEWIKKCGKCTQWSFIQL
jgi:hypothetical protein